MKVRARSVSILLLCGMVCLPAWAVQTIQEPQPTPAQEQLNFGVQAFKAGQFEAAVVHFRKATELDPELQNAHLYLATALAQQYVPGVEGPENVKFAQDAIGEYAEVLKLDANSINAIKGTGWLYMNLREFDKARDYYRKALAVNTQDPELYYSVGFIDWSQAYRERASVLSALGQRIDYSLIKRPACAKLRAANLSRVTDGIQMLKQALALRADYDSAMAYLNLLYREQAAIECGDPKAEAADVKTANEWVERAMAARKKKAEQQVPEIQK